jgi:hypothetical protein
MTTIRPEYFSKAVLALLDEAFDDVHGFFLDPHDSLFETLSGISAAEASVPVGGKCATLAAQIRHVAFYLDVFVKTFRNPNHPRVDWGEIWRTTSRVSPVEWLTIQQELRASYNGLQDFLKTAQPWQNDGEISDTIAVIAHTAYHLGEIRQALCTLQP